MVQANKVGLPMCHNSGRLKKRRKDAGTIPELITVGLKAAVLRSHLRETVL
jgi:hypothetical protein